MKTLLTQLSLLLIAALLTYAAAAFAYYELNPELWPIQARGVGGVGALVLFAVFSFLNGIHKIKV